MKKIAIEEHFTPGAVAAYMRSKKKDAGILMRFAERNMEEKRLVDMDQAGIDMQILSVALAAVEAIDPEDGTALSRAINDEIAGISKQYRGRFNGFAFIDPRFPEAAADELERAVTKLGLIGTMINSHVEGEYLDNPKFGVILERAAKLRVPIYIHPRDPAPDWAKPFRIYPDLLREKWGFAVETGLHAMRLICSGVFDRLPDLKFILGHMGEALPYWLYRMDGRSVPEGIKKKPSEYVKNNFYISTSGMFSLPPFLCAYLALGAERIMFAVDYPYASNQEAAAFINSVPVCDEDKAKICYLNAEKLLKLS